MAFTRPRIDELDIISKLGDDPNSDNGLSAADLKAKFDEGAKKLCNWFIKTMLVELEARTSAGNLGASLSDDATVTNVQAALEAVLAIAKDAQSGILIDGSVTTAKLASANPEADPPVLPAVSTAKIQDGAVTHAKLATVDANGENGAVDTDNINDGAITSAKLAPGAISGAVLTENSVVNAALDDGDDQADPPRLPAVTTSKINNGAVTTQKIADANVTNAKLASVDGNGANGAVSTDKINNGAVNADKIAANAVSTILTGTLTSSGWSGSAAPYSQTISVTGILAADNPIVDVTYSGTYATDSARAEAFANIYRIVTANGSITAYAIEKPTVVLPIRLLCIRK